LSGTLVKELSFAVTVWSGRYPFASIVLSLSVQVTVLLTPMTTVTVLGENPVDDWVVPAPFEILT
jgi:hypothetical protein